VVTVAKNRADVLARARAALADDGFTGEVHARGTGEIRGVPVTWTRTCHASGAFRETVEGALGHAVGYDGQRGWRVDESGMPGVVELGDLEELVVTAAVWSGRWARDDGGVIVEHVGPADAGRLVLGLRAGERGTRRFRLTLDAGTCLPRRLEQVGRDDVALEFDDIRPGGFGRIPFVLRSREAWLVDTMRVEAVERGPGTSSYALVHAPPRDVELAAAGAPLAWRRTRGKVPLVRASVDGQEVGWFVLDTGAGALAISDQAAAALALPELGRRFVRTSDGAAGAPYRLARALRVGPITIHRPRFLELDLAAFSKAIGVPLAGVLGYDLFMRAAVTIDVEAGITIAAAPPADGTWLDARFEEACPVVAARVPGPSGPREVWFALDTGSSAAVTLSAGAAPAIETRSRGRVSMRGVSGRVGARAGELAWIELAGHRIEDVSVVIARAGAGATGDPTPEPGVAGSLGMAILKDFALILDYQGRRVQLRRKKRTLPARPR
jgi:predicted aspartyl protease